jgi:hypothetical protein
MYRLIAFLGVCALVISNSPSAHSEVCPDAPGEIQIIDVPPGTNVRVMFFRARAEASYVEICESHDQEWKLVFAAGTEGGSWYNAIGFPPETGRYYIKNYSVRFWGSAPQPWVGMRKLRTSYGYTFNWFDDAGELSPNTVVEVCLYDSISKCPQHFRVRQAKNLAKMSEFARERWLQRWMKKSGYDKLKSPLTKLPRDNSV